MTTPARVLGEHDPSALDLAVEAIRAGLLVAVPTETVYGIACALNDAAVDRLVEAKGRDVGKGITLLVDDLADAAGLVVASPAARRLAGRFWPGPLTMVVPLQPDVGLPHAVTGGTRAVGLRVPDQPFTRRLARALGPLPLTSANRSGEPDSRDAGEVQARSAPRSSSSSMAAGRPVACPSTVVALEADGSWRLLRAGPITEAELARAFA